MNTIIIPQELALKGDLVIVPRKDYEELLEFQKKYIELDQDLDQAILQVREGKAVGPFESVKELKKSLEKWEFNMLLNLNRASSNSPKR